MPKGVKIDNQKIQEVMASYALTNSYNATAKATNVSDKTVKKIISEHSEEFAKVSERKKEEFADKASRVVDKAINLIEDRIDTARANQEELEEIIQMVWKQDKEELNETQKKAIVNKIAKMQLNSLSELTTAMGTIYDKMRLAKGEATTNNNITIKMSDAIKELSK